MAVAMPQVTREALEIVEGLSGSPEGIAPLRAVAPALVSNLLLCMPRPQLSRLAGTALVNLSQDDRICKELVHAKACSRIITYVVEGKTSDHDIAMMVLSNLTREQAGVAQALQVCLLSSASHHARTQVMLPMPCDSTQVALPYSAAFISPTPCFHNSLCGDTLLSGS